MPASKPKRRERTPDQQAAAQAARTQRIEGLHQQLAEGVEAIRDGQAWRDWLNIAGRLHTYSFNNQILIASQRPQASMVAGYQAWQALGRQVRKGEKAIWILAPVTRRVARPEADGPVDVEDPAAVATAPEPAPPGVGRGRGAVVGFRAAAVFDVDQSDGDPIPTPPRPQLLEGHAPPGLWEALTSAITARGFTVTRCATAADIGGANGITDYGTRTVTVRGDVDDAQAVKTLAHEAGHALLHNPQDRGAGPVCRDLIEVEAESVAYLVGAHHGLDTADYTFAYIAGWAGRDHDAVTNTARRVLDAARTLIAETDPATTIDPTTTAEVAAVAQTQTAAAQATATAADATRHRLAAALDPTGDRQRVILLEAQTWFQTQAATSTVYADAVTARGHTTAQATGYGVGWAPASWTGLVDHLRARGHTDTDLLAAGVAATARNGRLIDRFRARITFPIHDQHGIVGFTARDTTGHPDAPKYLNSPASGLFDKSRLLFGTQHLPRGSIDAQTITTIVLAEGPWDALAVTHAGTGDTVGVAACGTAVTDHHLDLALGRGLGRDLVLAPDNDPAGTTALGRTLAMLAQRGSRHPQAVSVTTGKDLADLHAAGGVRAVRGALAGARPGGLVYAEAHLAGHRSAGTPEARVAAARAAAAHSGGLTLGQRADLGGLLIRQAGIGPEAARAIVTPPAVVAPQPAAAAVPVPTGPAATRAGLRR